jgi:hypothetical protein
MSDDGLPQHKVAITVFCTVNAVDLLDAASIAERAVRQTLRGGQTGSRTEIAADFPGRRPAIARVLHVRETGSAASSGLLSIEATFEDSP